MTTFFPMTRVLDAALNGNLDTCRTADAQAILTPRADVLEGEKEYRIVMDLPGVQPDGLEINLENQTLFVKASRTGEVPEGFELRRHERAGKVQFNRTFNLGNAVDADHISAKLDEGILRIMLPKSQTSLPRRIEVK